MGEKVKFLYNHQTKYNNENKNKIGATTDKVLRTITAPAAGTTNYVRKFGLHLAIKDVTHLEDPIDVNLTISCYALDGTLLGSRVGGGAYVDGGTVATAQGAYLVCAAAGGAVTLNTFGPVYSVNTDAANYAFYLPQDVIANGSSITYYLSQTESTYYDENLMYGGARHTPLVGNELQPYFHPVAADTALGARTIVHVLDSCYYQIDEYAIANVNTIWQAALGETPHLVTVIGASEYRDVEHDGNNLDTAYVSKTGNDGAAIGSYQDPYLSHSHAFTNRGARTYINTMDSKEYDEQFTISAAIIIEPIYSKIVTFINTTATQYIFNLTSTNIKIYGIITNQFSSSSFKTIIFNNLANNFTGIFKNNTFQNGYYSIYFYCNNLNLTFNNNILCNATMDGLHTYTEGSQTGNILKNIIYNCKDNGLNIQNSGSSINNINIKNNKSYNNKDGIRLTVVTGSTHNGTIENNTCYNNSQYGLVFNHSGTFSGTYRNMICWDNSTDLYSTNIAITITYTDYKTKNANITAGAGCITTDPIFCKTILPYKLGIVASSGAYHTDSTSNNMGVRTFGLNITADDVIINGFIFDGLDNYVHGLIITSNTDYTGLDVKWCDFKDFQGIAVDLWDDGTNLAADILNCNFNNNGQGLALAYGGNTIQECLFYKNSKINIWVDRSGHIINHCVIYNVEYGLYVDSNGGGIICKNSIIAENSLYGIYSEIAMSIIYCCITDAVTSNVDITDSSNIINSPLFINTTDDNENFRIKTLENGYKIESPCKQVADDGYDMGAWLIDYSILQDYWEKYTVEFNPRNMNDLYTRKGGLQNEDAQGNYSGWSKSHKLRLPMVWAGNSATSENQRLTLRHFSEREQGRELEYTEAECEFLISLLPTKCFGQGVNATIDATVKTLTDNIQTWIKYNAKKGMHCTVIFDSKLAGNINAAAKTVTKIGAGWTIDEWIGYYFPYDGFYWYILSNTATVLTLSDPNGDLINNANFEFNITKQFKIQKSSKTVLTLRDDDSELISGSYDYYIDYIQCNVIGSNFGHKQAVYDIEKEKTKSGYALTFEEIN